MCQLRKKRGLSQEELGSELNVTRQTISKWELGQSKPDTDKLMEICKLLDVDLNQLADDDVKINIKGDSSDPDELKPRRWLLVVLIIIAILIVILLADKVITDRKKASENHNSWGIFDIFNFNGFNSLTAFNNQFEIYKGSNYGTAAALLLDEVITNNKKDSNHIITVIFEDKATSTPDEIKEIKKGFGTWDTYEITFDYDEKNYIEKVTIEKNKSGLDNFFKNSTSHNSGFEMYNGTRFGSSAKSLIDKIITNNKTNTEHIVTLVYGGVTTTDETELRNLKSQFDTFDNVEIWFDYDADNYIYMAHIQK